MAIAGPTDPVVLWQGSRPSLYGLATVTEGNLLVTTRRAAVAPDGTLVVAHDLSTGQELWSAELPIDTPPGSTSRVTGLRDGQVYATRSAWDLPDFLYALEASTGALVWRSEERIRESPTESVSFASNGDLVLGDFTALRRIDRKTGRTLWRTTRDAPNDGSAAVVVGERAYTWEFTAGGPRVTVFDVKTGRALYGSPVIGGCTICSQQVGLFAAPDGTVYAPRRQGNPATDQLAALRDTGTALAVRWSVPLGGGAFASFGVSPDGSVYSVSADLRLVRLDPATGAVRNASAAFTVPFFSPRLAIDAKGTVFLSNGHYGDQGRLYSFDADLTLRWVVDVPGILFGGPVLAANGALVIAGSGTNLTVFWTPSVGWDVAAVGDFDGDSSPDLMWRSGDGRLVAWFLDGLVRTRGRFVDPPLISPAWAVSGQGDFDGDGKADLLWRHAGSGELVVWRMDGERVASGTFATPSALADLDWRIAGTGDFNRDGRTDILWQHARSGEAVVWFMNGTALLDGTFLSPATVRDGARTIEGTGDFNADGQTDVLWRDPQAGSLAIWLMLGTRLAREVAVAGPAESLDWTIQATSDLDHDGATDILWRTPSGELRAWLMAGSILSQEATPTPDRFLTLDLQGGAPVSRLTGAGGGID